MGGRLVVLNHVKESGGTLQAGTPGLSLRSRPRRPGGRPRPGAAPAPPGHGNHFLQEPVCFLLPPGLMCCGTQPGLCHPWAWAWISRTLPPGPPVSFRPGAQNPGFLVASKSREMRTPGHKWGRLLPEVSQILPCRCCDPWGTEVLEGLLVATGLPSGLAPQVCPLLTKVLLLRWVYETPSLGATLEPQYSPHPLWSYWLTPHSVLQKALPSSCSALSAPNL